MFARAMLMLVLLLPGCTSHPLGPPTAENVCWNLNLRHARSLWETESQRRFDDPIVVICHGGPNEQGVWTAFPDSPRTNIPVQALAEILRDLYPGRSIVLVVCNESERRLFGLPNVWYAKGLVWARPDSVVPFPRGPGVGDIFEFVEAR